MKKLLPVLALTILCSSCTTYYYVVRHAEKLNTTSNTPLSPTGFQRADALRDSLNGKGIDSIFVSTFLRTQQTAGPLATALQLTPVIHSPDTTAGLITRLKKIHGKDVLVVSHSDKVPLIVEGLSGQSVPAIAENDFDNLYIIRVKKCMGTRRTLWHKTYGAPTP
jgi:broad specificity phosphatase PhoE